MSLYAGQPQTETQRNLALLPVCGPLGLDPAQLSEMETLHLEALLEHLSAAQGLDESLRNLSPPYVKPGGPLSRDDQEQLNEWHRAYEELMLQKVQEDCCWALPLDSEFGESLKARELTHWLGAPGLDWRSEGLLGLKPREKKGHGTMAKGHGEGRG